MRQIQLFTFLYHSKLVHLIQEVINTSFWDAMSEGVFCQHNHILFISFSEWVKQMLDYIKMDEAEVLPLFLVNSRWQTYLTILLPNFLIMTLWVELSWVECVWVLVAYWTCPLLWPIQPVKSDSTVERKGYTFLKQYFHLMQSILLMFFG